MEQHNLFKGFSNLTAIILALAIFPNQSSAGALHIYRGDMSRAIEVAPKTVMELEITAPFDELVVANPSIVDVWTLSDTRIELRAQSKGITTLTVRHSTFPETAPSEYEIIVKPDAQTY